MLKYFPEGYDAYEFDEQEMNRIIACAFSVAGAVTMIKTVIKERPAEGQEAETTDIKSETAETGESDTEEDDYDEAEDDGTDDEEEENVEGEN